MDDLYIKPRKIEKLKSLYIKIGFIISSLIIWELVARYSQRAANLIPSVTEILKSLWHGIMSGEILQHLGYSLYLIFSGIGIGILLATVLTALYIINKPFSQILDIIISIMHPLPGIALLPIVMLIFGLGPQAIIIVIIHSVLWPIIINTVAGFRTVPRTQIELGRSIGLSEFRLVFSVMIPNAFPHIFSGLKIAWSRSWRALVGAEMIFGSVGLVGGLGWFIYKKRYFLEISDVFAGLLVIILIGLLVEEGIMKQIENNTLDKWGISI